MKRILVTGAGGFIGRHVMQQLVGGEHEVHAVYSQHQGPVDVDSSCMTHTVDLLAPGTMTRLIEAVRPEYLMHLAWCAKPGVYWSSPENLLWVRATLELLQAFQCQGGQHAVMVGSCAEYDWQYGYCREETTPLVPATVYGRCKNATRELAEVFAQVHDMPIAWARIFNAYGPYEAPGRLVPAVISALLKGEPARCSHGEQWRDFLHAADVASALVMLLQSKAEGAFNIGSGQPVRLREVVEYLASQLNAVDLLHMGAIAVAADDPPLLVADNQRLVKLGWKAQFDLQHGLDNTLAWWRGRV
jgi:nucleoside-diphosphate-sugar epimerase